MTLHSEMQAVSDDTPTFDEIQNALKRIEHACANDVVAARTYHVICNLIREHWPRPDAAHHIMALFALFPAYTQYLQTLVSPDEPAGRE